ncbi:MAG TPA: sugar transferase [Gaiellaceae bacterium]|nr:sugar transferase [Gaiellaceae bacterium]
MATKPLLAPSEPSESPQARTVPTSSELLNLGRRLVSVVALLAIDLGGLAAALYLALVLRELYYGNRPILWGIVWDAEAKWLPFLTLITALVFWRAGLYAPRERRAGAGRIVSSLLLVTLLTLAFVIGGGYQHTTFGLYATAFVLAAILISSLRASYELISAEVWRVAGVRRRALLVGDEERIASLRHLLGRSRGGIDYEFVGTLSPAEVRDLAGVLARLPADELIVSGADLEEEELVELVDVAHRHAVKVRIAPTTADVLTQRAEYVPGQGVPLFELRPPVVVGLDWSLKRSFDLLVSAVGAILLTPLWLLVGLAVKLDSPGPVFYRDRRVGLGEREFGMFKFRSMFVDAADRQAGLEADNEASGPLFKIKDDPRVTRVGRLLRRYSIDELPQLFNVLRGDMSLVGPRPLPLRDFVQLEDWHRKRYLVLPGMTGLWQVSGRIELTFDDLVRLDFYYLENWSIWLDVSILAKTLPAVAARRGAY